ncbi:MAG: antibiotic biosynthesis monooxygenase [Pseudomonadales bacterium]|jgi:heme-degrading monooxygenase HmoA|uniref:antibiotic biosynthesis monooxygenase family protein n=1 Tax=unclassified Ketobacter TaxID=2639109 RepID=UPI000C419E0A|nr:MULTISPECIES: antibiotic biosynthesis monooxygenase [unclassified Ketobacter]MAQ27442.1 antibiotic biosynthesis monooxygenase [Pseudomonadales bacterium]MEC8812392.1 antibiotic biosynthesis monooxygenase [Pseudomonadota bacterium]TNC87228.1 MAG: antibiotic biosynthesis monooxygenase [Alcanivorax sp.]HAG93871.1 antibiotic biosynthesis monooxygenase [Gammaproteobacteria bacterium]MBI27709.1 antibiotic biosynthesis monooxygenase [Pseudomonadales bacterium]|tara:strand:+ start:9750 stop:10052 length:303 start_codon:yes stop_codon:yes gene_type:complete
MYIAMNRFRIAPGREQDFINIWKNRDTHLDEVPGFRQFNLLQGATDEQCTLFTSHSVWDSEEAFVNWTKSEAFRKAHAQAGDSKGIYLGPPQFEGFKAVL